ncbi:hypothetical protein N7539_001206 [Penicillium diatomitis]|uniref:Protein phosphatase 4 core regulatory subunit R2 n=1 Tax=Penicillium diatomitis TaxID=2819901 RepID=A0A9X0C3E1_9EURO|nr:uncharacterized protein N7539_001206 [Penicillium diatomitis]KAJ5496090.1 hypothetical protein N7539_001206 [Penicillium diatomitis]
MSLDEEALTVLANGGSIDPEKWKRMVQPLLERLDYNIHNVFPMPRESPSSHAPPQSPQPVLYPPPEGSNKENDAPGSIQSDNQQRVATDSVPLNDPISTSQSASEPLETTGTETTGTLPPPLALLLRSTRSSIQTFFTEKPPHTVQRLAELILHPSAHYKSLPAYLRAVDRVISVTSGADVFPLSASNNTKDQANGITPNSLNSAGAFSTADYASALGSDESLGGALLTPIPWLSGTSFVAEDGVMLDDHITTVPPPQEIELSEAPVADGGDVPRPGMASSPTEPSEDVPHARGPSVLGVEDLGLQDGKGVEMELIAQEEHDGTSNTSPVETNSTEGGTGAPDQDGDISLDDDTPKDEAKPNENSTGATEGNSEPSQVEDSQ